MSNYSEYLKANSTRVQWKPHRRVKLESLVYSSIKDRYLKYFSLEIIRTIQCLIIVAYVGTRQELSNTCIHKSANN